MVQDYLTELKREISLYYRGEKLETIYIGGGTPSCLTSEELETLFEIIGVFHRSDTCEFTIEGNFDSTSFEKLLIYQKYGVNRLSFGIESTHPSQMSFLNRSFSKESVNEVLKNCHELGFYNINVDLIYAIPGETCDILEEDLNYLFSLEVPHISTYSLMIEDHTKLGIDGVSPLSQDEDFSMYQLICQKMRENNYEHYEISNFAKDGYYSSHNLCYWNNLEYYGFGLGASSYFENVRISNSRSITEYLHHTYQREREELTFLDKMEYEILLNLRKKEGIDLLKFSKTYHQDLVYYFDYRDLVLKKLLVEEKNHLFIPEDKWYISNEIIVKILEREVIYE